MHGGHIGDDEDLAVGHERWRKALESVDLAVPVLLENTAGGAMPSSASATTTVRYGRRSERSGWAWWLTRVTPGLPGEDMATLIDQYEPPPVAFDWRALQRLPAIHRGAAATATPISAQVKSLRT